ncbi:MAG: ATP-grasp fold amidoligase family protein, partial [Candidatus Rokuibacteriota bacterium]
MGPRSLGWLVKELARRVRRRLQDYVPDRVVLARRYQGTFGRRLNLRHPQTFNEKLYWLMLYYRPPLATTVADKYAVRSYVAERVGPGILNELYGVWDHASDIDFDA